jgi:multidrug efflux pump subunit AcrA (membrane-fusion protein)
MLWPFPPCFLIRRWSNLLLVAIPALAVLLSGCKRETAHEAPPRPVRTVVVETGGLGGSIVLTGQIQAEKEVALAFRIGGRIIERLVDTGDRVTSDQVVAKLDPQNELNSLRSARAALSGAMARLEQDSNHFDRQDTLLKQGWTTRANFDQAQQALRTRAQGRELWNAVVEGAVSRFRPIMLTAISTVLGFIPIAPTVFWGPMAFAIMGGLFVATLLTLLVLPALYVIFFRVSEPKDRPAS